MTATYPIQNSHPAYVTPLAGTGRAAVAQVLSIAGKTMELALDQPVASGAAVLVQSRDWLMLGEVQYCALERGRHRARLRLEHALPGLHELSNISRRFSGQATRAQLTDRDGYSGWT